MPPWAGRWTGGLVDVCDVFFEVGFSEDTAAVWPNALTQNEIRVSTADEVNLRKAFETVALGIA